MQDMLSNASAPTGTPPRKRSRWWAVIGLFVVLTGLAYLLYVNGDWITYLPDSTIIANVESDDVRYAMEAMDRFHRGAFNSADLNLYLQSQIAEPKITMRDSYPVGIPINIQLQPVLWMSNPFEMLLSVESELLVDGKVERTNKADAPARLDYLLARRFLQFPALEKGTHTLGVRCTYRVWQSGMQTDTQPPICTKTGMAERTVRVEGTLDDVATPTTDGLIVAMVEQRVALAYRTQVGAKQLLALRILEAQLPIRIAADVWVRPKNAMQYVLAGTWNLTSESILLKGGKSVEKAESLDILLAPSGAVAFDAGYNRYFGGTIEWLNVRIAPIDMLDEGLSNYVYPPNEVRPDTMTVEKLKKRREF